MPTIANRDAYEMGRVNRQWSLPLGYWLEGWIFTVPRIGDPVRILRINRNGVSRLGIFVSSPVVSSLGGLSFATRNSLYHCAPVDFLLRLS